MGNESRRSGNASQRPRPPPPATVVAATTVAPAALAQPEKRGRAQKKRARKIKEKMRQLCADSAAGAAAIVTADTMTLAVRVRAGGSRSISPKAVGRRTTVTCHQQSEAPSGGEGSHAGVVSGINITCIFAGLEQSVHPTVVYSEFAGFGVCWYHEFLHPVRW